MNSPYLQGGGAANFMPPQNLLRDLAFRDAAGAQAGADAGSFIGSLGAGIGGAIQGGQQPGVFGAGTGATSGAAQGFMANFNAGYNGGGGGMATGFSGLKTSDNPGGGGVGAGMNFKQLAQLGKGADNLVAGLGGDDFFKQAGMDPQQYKNMGAAERFRFVHQQTVEIPKIKAQQQAYQAGAMEMARLGQEMQMRQQVLDQGSAFGEAMRTAQAAAPPMIARPGAPTSEDPMFKRFAAAASPQAWASPQAAAFREAAAQGEASGFQFDPSQHVVKLEGGDKFIQTSRGGGQVMQSTERLIETKPDYDPSPGKMWTRMGRYWREVEDPTQWETITEGGQYGEPRISRKVFVGNRGAGAPASANPATDSNELVLAQEAIAAGTDRDKVAAKYKQRTGKELPK